jgi:mono/diheme cytochrome c family protein
MACDNAAMIRSAPGLVAAAALIFAAVVSISIEAQAPRTVQDGVFSDAQASRGQALYAQRCATCHGPALEGAQAPPLTGEGFTTKFRAEPLSALFIQIRFAMPPNAAGSAQLTSEQAADLVAHILKSNGLSAGKTDLAGADGPNSQTAWPSAVASPGGTAPLPAAYLPAGNLNQLMRGIFFPHSNLIFTIQEVEAKDLPPPPPPSRPDGLTIFDWGLVVYTGWPAVENSATALADASRLLTVPGLRCENGRAAPVTEPDWIRFTDQMIAVAKRTYRLAQTKNKDAVSEFTTDLSNACNACHRVYRDVFGRGRGRGGNLGDTSGRCMHR